MFAKIRRAYRERRKWKDIPSTPLPTSAVKELRGKPLLFLKLDLAYFAAAATLISVFKLDRQEVIQFGRSFIWFIVAFFFLATFDCMVESTVLDDWIAAEVQAPKRRSGKVLGLLVTLEQVFHFLFVSLIGLFFLGYLAY